MNDAVLDLGFQEGSVDGCIKSGQVTRAGDENILHVPVFQAVQHSGSELGAFIFPDPYAKYVLVAVQINANGDVNRLLHNLSFTADMVVDGIQENHGADGLQWPLLPLPGDGKSCR